jgi:hypothetical protein
MIREQTLIRLADLLGPCQQSSSHWRWTIAQPHHHPIHVVMSSANNDRAHVLISNPAAPNGERVVDLLIASIEDASNLVERLRRLL